MNVLCFDETLMTKGGIFNAQGDVFDEISSSWAQLARFVFSMGSQLSWRDGMRLTDHKNLDVDLLLNLVNVF